MCLLDGWMNGWRDFTSFTVHVFQSYKGDRWVIMKGCVGDYERLYGTQFMAETIQSPPPAGFEPGTARLEASANLLSSRAPSGNINLKQLWYI